MFASRLKKDEVDNAVKRQSTHVVVFNLPEVDARNELKPYTPVMEFVNLHEESVEPQEDFICVIRREAFQLASTSFKLANQTISEILGGTYSQLTTLENHLNKFISLAPKAEDGSHIVAYSGPGDVEFYECLHHSEKLLDSLVDPASQDRDVEELLSVTPQMYTEFLNIVNQLHQPYIRTRSHTCLCHNLQSLETNCDCLGQTKRLVQCVLLYALDGNFLPYSKVCKYQDRCLLLGSNGIKVLVGKSYCDSLSNTMIGAILSLENFPHLELQPLSAEEGFVPFFGGTLYLNEQQDVRVSSSDGTVVSCRPLNNGDLNRLGAVISSCPLEVRNLDNSSVVHTWGKELAGFFFGKGELLKTVDELQLGWLKQVPKWVWALSISSAVVLSCVCLTCCLILGVCRRRVGRTLRIFRLAASMIPAHEDEVELPASRHRVSSISFNRSAEINELPAAGVSSPLLEEPTSPASQPRTTSSVSFRAPSVITKRQDV